MALSDLYSKKQVEVLKRVRGEDWFMLINHGAVRAGKTNVDNDIFLQELIRVKKTATSLGIDEPMYILGGVSSGTIQTNILQELTNKYGIEFQFDKHNNFKLFGVKIIQTFTGTIAGLKSIRGMTAFGAYINEGTLANKEVFDEIIKRCSGEGARIICDTNPDHPGHWLKKDYIDNPSKNIISFHFVLTDNTFLSQRYIDNLIETTPSGVFTDRGIFGLWTVGEGAVYKDFDGEKHYIHSSEVPKLTHFYCGVDWGYEHYGSIVVVGQTDSGEAYLIEEYAKQHEEIDYWVDIAKDVQKRYGRMIPFYCDTARPEHIARFTREKLNAIYADKSILSGVEAVARRFKNGKLFVMSDKVEKFKEEIYQYIWDKKSGKPREEHDDVLDALRYAIYSSEVYGKSTAKERVEAAKLFFG